MKEALFYERLSDNAVRCRLCSHGCKIEDAKRGICGVRENHEGTLYSLVYGKVIAEHIDPMEKKPLFHFLPGSKAFSIGTVGCNFHCKHCQNADISQYPQEHQGRTIGEARTPEELVKSAKATHCEAIAYTYTEPTIFYEFAYDTAMLARSAGIKNVFVSNGYMTPDAARHIGPYLDAINVDLKSFSDRVYKQICGGRLKPVLGTVQLMKELGVWVEVTTLVIPDLNDANQELQQIARFLKGIDPAIPWHVTQFYPAYRLVERPPTPMETLRRARQIGLDEGLHYVYEGNVLGEKGENTYCRHCGTLLIERRGMQFIGHRIRNGKCPDCETSFDGVVS